MKRVKSLIIGYYGSDNIGDEMLLKASIDLLNRVYEHPEITAITYSVMDTREKHKINGISRNKYFEIVRAIGNSDIVIGGGGSMLQNVTSNRSLIYYLTILFLATIMGKKVLLLGNGIGPLRGGFFKKITLIVLRRLDALVLRDRESYEFLRDHGLRNIYLGNDLAFTLKFDRVASQPGKIALNLRKWVDNREFNTVLKDFTKYLIGKGFKVVLLPFQKGNDDIILGQLAKSLDSENLIFPGPLGQERLLNEISTSEIFIGMRLHGLIFSSMFRRPFIGLSYDPKVSIFSQEQGQICIENLDEISLEILIDAFEKLYGELNHYNGKLEENMKTILSLNSINEEVLRNISIGED
ncbi:MAG: polysaccharide pyruvyl transferase CsaB [Tissierellaceae bacterium]